MPTSHLHDAATKNQIQPVPEHSSAYATQYIGKCFNNPIYAFETHTSQNNSNLAGAQACA